MKRCMVLILALVIVLTLSFPAFSADGNSEAVPLDRVFEESALLPFDFHGFAFKNGGLYTSYNEAGYKNYNVDGRVLVPIRLVADMLQDNDNYWEVVWDAADPQLVTLNNQRTGDRVIITVGQKTMEVNGEEVPLDVPAQYINNRMVLPLRAVGEAVAREVNWLDGMVIISKVPVDLGSAETADVVNKVKALLSGCTTDVDNKQLPVTYYNGGYYTLKTYYDENDDYITELYYIKDGNATRVELTGEAKIRLSYGMDGLNTLSTVGKVGDSIYYPTVIDEKTFLYRLDFSTNQSVLVCSLVDNGWTLENFNGWGWLSHVLSLDGDIFVVLHSGDLTMGYDNIYCLEDGNLTGVGGAKWLSSITKADGKLYYTSLEFMGMSQNNIYCADLSTGEGAANIALDGYTYDIVRKKTDSSISYSANAGLDGLAVKDGYLYAMIYEEQAEKDNRNIVKIDTHDNSQEILPIEVEDFRLVGDVIIYQEYTGGQLMKCDLDGMNAIALVDADVELIQIYGDQIYYTLQGEAGLYRLDLLTGDGEKITDIKANDILLNQSGSYFINTSYDAGIYKISGGEAVKVYAGFAGPYANTDAGILYNKRGSGEVYLAD